MTRVPLGQSITMPPKRPSIERLRDIEIAARDCLDLVSNMNFEEFMSAEQTQVLAARKLEVIGEAVSHIPESILSKAPEIPWSDIIGMRIVVAHKYFSVNYKIVWWVVQNDLQPLLKSVRSLLDELDTRS